VERDRGSLTGPDGRKVCDIRDNNLHLIGYSEPVETTLPLAQLRPRLHSLPAQPDAIPYITSYYKRYWGFCLADRQLRALPEGDYRVVIKSELKPGHLTYAELILPGETTDEIFFSTYVCHPSIANNELSGPVVTAKLVQWLQSLPRRRHTFRFFFGPETIGSICYLSRNLAALRRNVKAGYVVTCVGDERTYSFLPSRLGHTLADRLTRQVLRSLVKDYKTYTFLDRGSDERQYCSPGADLPMVSVMRSKYQEYPEYHTSLDDLRLVTPAGLAGALAALKGCVYALESNRVCAVNQPCEPQLGKRGLYPNLSTTSVKAQVADMMNFLAYCDGRHDFCEIADIINVDVFKVIELAEKFLAAGLIHEVPRT
jgi:aminopeptidase-like protein